MKSIWQSKTFWVAALTTVSAALVALGGTDFVKEYPAVSAGIVSVLGLVNIALRFVTSEAVKLK